jgi:signal transduction histidine kinase
MKPFLRGKRGGLAAFLVIAGLVAGGLGWATAAALRLEREQREQREQRAEADRATRLAGALWRLDTYAAPILAREDNRPFDHYGAVHLSPLLGNTSNFVNPNTWNNGAALELSPLLTARFDDWTPLHFQVDARGWKSPQVIEPDVKRQLERVAAWSALANVTDERSRLLAQLQDAISPEIILAAAREHTHDDEGRDATLFLAQRKQTANSNDRNNDTQAAAQQPAANPPFPNTGPGRQDAQALLQNDEVNRAQFVQNQFGAQSRGGVERRPRPFALNALEGNQKKLISPPVNWEQSTEVTVAWTGMVPVWLTGKDGDERLLAVRMVRIVGEDHEVCQGVVFDADRLKAVLAAKVADLLPEATVVPVRDASDDRPGQTMISLPFRLDLGPLNLPPEPSWTPLRFGLTMAWTAALVALLAVGLGGWSLLDLSERRIRFVSAVTHELRTPLTTLRLYLDMLLGGLVRDEKQQREYLETLHAESDRLTRLVGNVLDFSRLENQRPRLNRAPVEAAAVLDRARDTWDARCKNADKELVVENALGDTAILDTDAELLAQVLGNLIDNACKYSRGADDRRVWLRARREKERVVFEVEDRGPGVPAGERRTIFRPFRRGHNADVTAGGVGLGLALARRWAALLGGKLTLGPAPAEGGACFQVWLPQ